jgi:hypothetical protein
MARCAPLSIMNRYAEESVAPSSSTSMAIELKRTRVNSKWRNSARGSRSG